MALESRAAEAASGVTTAIGSPAFAPRAACKSATVTGAAQSDVVDGLPAIVDIVSAAASIRAKAAPAASCRANVSAAASGPAAAELAVDGVNALMESPAATTWAMIVVTVEMVADSAVIDRAQGPGVTTALGELVTSPEEIAISDAATVATPADEVEIVASSTDDASVAASGIAIDAKSASAAWAATSRRDIATATISAA